MERKDVLISAEALARQRKFQERVREMYETRQAHPLACVETFGCQQNVADGQRIMGMLEAMGFGFTQEPREADLVILNTSSFSGRSMKPGSASFPQRTSTAALRKESRWCGNGA